jgi:hypothetical protein
MTAIEFALALARLAGIVLPALVLAGTARRRLLGVGGAVAVLVDAIVAFSAVLIVSELLGLVGLMRMPVLIPVLMVLAGIAWWLCRGRHGAAASPRSGASAGRGAGRFDATTLCALAAVAVVWAQWCVQTADALGAGMANFDTLWYHMPFAARMAQTGAVSAIQFTQADPYVAYYPANSELFHALGIEAMHNDFLSPLLNLVWLAVAMLASWCFGRPWRIERVTLIAGCLVLSLPVLSGSQPGEAYNDIVGLAMLLAAAAVVVNADGDRRLMAVAGLALGVALGTKFTFVVPACVLVVGLAAGAGSGRRRRLGALVLPLALTAGWWYLRNLIAVGNPEGLQLHIGPLVLPGPVSPLANASQQTVFSQLSHVSLWGSRFAPGLSHALGPLWPLVLALYVVAVVAGMMARGNPTIRVLAITAAATGVSYLFLPTGATAIDQGSALFQVNLRYATPALVLGVVLLAVVVQERAPRLLGALGPSLLLVLLGAQLERELWPTQTARHLVFLIAAAAVTMVAFGAGRAIAKLPRSRLAIAASGILLALGGAAYVVQRHYFDRRYLAGGRAEPVLASIYAWAQGVEHARIALYGDVQQYPLYGARDSNEVDYLGAATGDGGFRPISSCRDWRTKLNRGRYRYVVLTPAPTAPIPVAWTQSDPVARLVLQPAADAYVFEITGALQPGSCA